VCRLNNKKTHDCDACFEQTTVRLVI